LLLEALCEENIVLKFSTVPVISVASYYIQININRSEEASIEAAVAKAAWLMAAWRK